MHRKNPISVLVYNTLFPSPSPTDPPSFSAHLSKNLVGEVRIETATFYGSLDTIEARYPGLNYAHAPHRKRLGRFPHHKRLFAAFDRLGLTDSEIQGFCRWEGTLWARERYERDEGVKVHDTTGVEITDWVDRRKHRYPSRHGSNGGSGTHKGINVKTDIEVEIEQVVGGSGSGSGSGSSSSRNPHSRSHSHANSHSQSHPHQHQHPHSISRHHNHHTTDTEMPDPTEEQDPLSNPASDSEEENPHNLPDNLEDDQDTDLTTAQTSIGNALNARLLHAAALRDMGQNVPMDPEWEQYLKEAQERGVLSVDATREALRIMAGELARMGREGPSAGAGSASGVGSAAA